MIARRDSLLNESEGTVEFIKMLEEVELVEFVEFVWLVKFVKFNNTSFFKFFRFLLCFIWAIPPCLQFYCEYPRSINKAINTE